MNRSEIRLWTLNHKECFRTLVTKRKSRLSRICFSYLSQFNSRQKIFKYPTTDYEIAFKCEELDKGGGGRRLPEMI